MTTPPTATATPSKPTNPPPTPPTADRSTIQTLDELVRQAGRRPRFSIAGKRVRELMHTALKLLADEADDGEIKLLSRSIKELRYALKVFRPYAETRKITIFGSARTAPTEPAYLAASDFARQMADHGWMIITGAGDGIMRAGNGGGGQGQVVWRLHPPALREQRQRLHRRRTPSSSPSDTSSPASSCSSGRPTPSPSSPAASARRMSASRDSPSSRPARHRWSPSSWSTRPGDDYWKRWDAYVRGELLPAGLIGPEDLNLYRVTTDPADAVAYVREFYRNFHSQRFVKDTLLLRMQRPLEGASRSTRSMRSSRSLVKEGRIELSDPLRAERDEAPGLPRLKFAFRMRGYGKLRAMIDRINAFDRENTGGHAPGPEEPAPHSPRPRRADPTPWARTPRRLEA